MKNTKLVLGLAVMTIGFASCKDEKAEQAEKKIDSYVTYVDSLGNVAEAEAEGNWKAIESSYDMRVVEAEAAIADIKDNTAEQARIDASKAKYEALKIKSWCLSDHIIGIEITEQNIEIENLNTIRKNIETEFDNYKIVWTKL